MSSNCPAPYPLVPGILKPMNRHRRTHYRINDSQANQLSMSVWVPHVPTSLKSIMHNKLHLRATRDKDSNQKHHHYSSMPRWTFKPLSFHIQIIIVPWNYSSPQNPRPVNLNMHMHCKPFVNHFLMKSMSHSYSPTHFVKSWSIPLWLVYWACNHREYHSDRAFLMSQ